MKSNDIYISSFTLTTSSYFQGRWKIDDDVVNWRGERKPRLRSFQKVELMKKIAFGFREVGCMAFEKSYNEWGSIQKQTCTSERKPFDLNNVGNPSAQIKLEQSWWGCGSTELFMIHLLSLECPQSNAAPAKRTRSSQDKSSNAFVDVIAKPDAVAASTATNMDNAAIKF